MGNIKIKASQELFLFTKRVFVNNEYYGKFRSNETTIDIDKDFENLNIRVDIFFGYYTSEVNIPESESKSYVIFLEDKLSRLYRIAYIIAIIVAFCLSTLDVMIFHLLDFPFPTLLLCGAFFIFLLDLSKRKKRFSTSIYALE